MSPFLFLIVIDYIVHKTMYQPGFSIGWKNDKRLTDLDLSLIHI